MKKLLKGLGASLGYILIYLVITFLVMIAGSIVYGIIAGVNSVNTNFFIDSFLEDYNSFFSESILIFTVIAGIMSLFIYWLIIKARKKSVKERLDLNPVPFRRIWPIIPLGIFFNIFISHLMEILPIPQQVIDDYAKSSSSLSGDITIELILATVIAAPIVEEVIFRGLVLKSLHQGMPFIIALILQAIGFGVLHGQILWIIYTTFFGVALGIVKTRYSSLYPCILLHLVFNGWNFAMSPIYYCLPDELYVNILLLVVSAVIIVLMGILIFKKTVKEKTFESIDLTDSLLPVGEIEPQTITMKD